MMTCPFPSHRLMFIPSLNAHIPCALALLLCVFDEAYHFPARTAAAAISVAAASVLLFLVAVAAA